MAKVNREWRVLKHGPIERFEENLWIVTDKPAEVLHQIAAAL